MCWTSLFEAPEPDQWFRTAAHVTRLILEPCADLARFIRQSGDPGLLSGYPATRGRSLPRNCTERPLGTIGAGRSPTPSAITSRGPGGDLGHVWRRPLQPTGLPSEMVTSPIRGMACGCAGESGTQACMAADDQTTQIARRDPSQLLANWQDRPEVAERITHASDARPRVLTEPNEAVQSAV